MGSKRPVEDEGVNEFPLKHLKQVNFDNDLTSFSLNFPELEETKKPKVAGEDDDMYFKIQLDGSDMSKDDTGSVPEYTSPFSPEYVDFHFPRRLVHPLKETYSSLLENPPRKQVEIGLDHQATLPVWDPQLIFNDYDGELMGECVQPLSDVKLSTPRDDVAGYVWKGCTCPDEGSIRCVQQHVKEAREALRVTLGDEKFENLGFCDMGEDVSEKWSDEEERIFHQVVYTKVEAHRKNFWNNLSMVLPSRTKAEIVSYYFNVFILRRRFVQNRSRYLDIDSDDDEWDESYWYPLGFEQEGDDSDSDSLLPVDEDDYPIDDDVDNDACKMDCEVGLKENGSGSSNGLNSDFPLGFEQEGDESDSDSILAVDEYDHPIADNVDKVDCEKDSKVGLKKIGGGSTYGSSSGYPLEPCNSKLWDDNFQMSPLKFFDIPPTGNNMEDIFGPYPKNNGSIL